MKNTTTTPTKPTGTPMKTFNMSTLKMEYTYPDPKGNLKNSYGTNPLNGDNVCYADIPKSVLDFRYTPSELIAFKVLANTILDARPFISTPLQVKYGIHHWQIGRDGDEFRSYVHTSLRSDRTVFVTYSNVKPALEEITAELESQVSKNKGLEVYILVIKECLKFIRK